MVTRESRVTVMKMTKSVIVSVTTETENKTKQNSTNKQNKTKDPFEITVPVGWTLNTNN